MATNLGIELLYLPCQVLRVFLFLMGLLPKKNMTVERQTIFLNTRFIKNKSRLALCSIKSRGEGSWALCTSFLIPDTLRLHTPNAYNNPFSPPPIKNPRSASEQSHPIMGSKGLALPSNQCCPGSNPCVDAICG